LGVGIVVIARGGTTFAVGLSWVYFAAAVRRVSVVFAGVGSVFLTRGLGVVG